MATLSVRVVSPDRIVWEGEASSVVVPAWDGQLGFLPGHAPEIALLGMGEMHLDQPGGGSVLFQIAGGTVKVEENAITILTEYCGDEPPKVIPEGIHFEKEDLMENLPAGNPFA